MKKILTICTTPRDRRELSYPEVRGDYQIVHHDFDADLIDQIVSRGSETMPHYLTPEYVIDEITGIVQRDSFDGIIATDDYPGSLFASYIAQQKNFKAPPVDSLLRCQHKYYGRLAQAALVPHATPAFQVVTHDNNQKTDIILPFPFFIKPVKSYFSLYANRVNSHHDLQRILSEPKKMCLYHFDWFLKDHPEFVVPSQSLLAEGLLEGVQVTLDGFVHNGTVYVQGVVDSIMFPQTICFSRFDYPSKLPDSVQKRMAAIATTLMAGIGFDNGAFNIEFMYDQARDRVSIIEVNPRMASQFADLYQKVDGTNTYSLLLDIAAGQQPHFTPKQGQYACASSYVLRTFQDHYVVKKPHEDELASLYDRFPDLRLELFGREGHKLSEELQDGKSFRYGYIHLGAGDAQELNEKIEACKRLLPLRLEPIH